MDNFEGATSLSKFLNSKDAVKFLRNHNAQQLNMRSSEPFVDVARQITHTKALLELNDFSTSSFSQGENLIFIVGLPRSGKSSLEHILSNDLSCINGGELSVVSNLFSSYTVKNTSLKYPLYMRDLNDNDFKKMGKQAIDIFAKKYDDPEKKIIITMPSNFLYIPLLQKILPHSKIIWCHRNTKHHTLNLFIKHFRSSYWNFTYDMESIIKVLQAHEKFIALIENNVFDAPINYQYHGKNGVRGVLTKKDYNDYDGDIEKLNPKILCGKWWMHNSETQCYSWMTKDNGVHISCASIYDSSIMQKKIQWHSNK